MNEGILYLDIISVLTIVLLSKLFLKSLKNPIFLICAWWSAFAFLSNIVVINQGIGLETHLVFLLFIYSILGFGILFEIYTSAATFPAPTFLIRHRTIWIVVAILIYLITIWLGVVGYKLQKVYESEFRELSFASDKTFSLLYGYYALELSAALALAPAVLFGCIALPLTGIFYNNYKLYLLGLIFSAAADFQRSGRANLYIFVLATALTAILLKRTTLSSLIIPIAGALAAIFPAMAISQQRMQSDEIHAEVAEAILEEGLYYHVYGAYLFDDVFSNERSILHQGTSFGRLSLLAYPDTLACIALRQFGINAAPEIDRFGPYWQTPVRLGYRPVGTPIMANAFYTTLFPIFYDFGYLGVILVPGLIVYFLVLHYKTYLRSNSITSLFAVVFLSIFFMTSIFNSKITSPDFSIIFYCILFLTLARAFSHKRTPRVKVSCLPTVY